MERPLKSLLGIEKNMMINSYRIQVLLSVFDNRYAFINNVELSFSSESFLFYDLTFFSLHFFLL